MPFGLCNAPATFERLMELVLRGLPWTTCLVYLDNILVHGRSFADNVRCLREVLGRFRYAFSPRKCKLFRREVACLGHVISANGVATDPTKIAAIDEWPVPDTTEDVRCFICLCTYYRRFVPEFAAIAKPLHRLTEKGKAFAWTDECAAAFQRLKQVLTAAPVLAFPESGCDFTVDTDASDVGIGCVSSQVQDGKERVIAYYSRTLRKTERNYCVTRKEPLAVVTAVGQFHHYLYGLKFLVRNYHASLQWVLRFKNPDGQTARWLQKRQEYDFKVIHRAGKSHTNADALSRVPRPCLMSECRLCLRNEQREEDTIAPVLKWKELRQRPSWAGVSAMSEDVKIYWAQWTASRCDRKLSIGAGNHLEAI